MLQNIDKVAWLHIRSRKLLGAKSKGKTPFYSPGGKREESESDMDVLVRELKEELNIDFKQETARFIGKFEAQAHGKPEGIMVVIRGYDGEYEGVIQPSAEVEEVGWLTSEDIDTERTSPVDKVILKYLKDRDLID